jgi:hypothetical protein
VKNSFFLVIPPQQKNTERLKLYQEETLKQWIIDLPVANPGLATRLFHDFIKDFNKTEMDVQLRLDTLETLKPSFLDIEDYLRARLAKAGFPKAENEQKILEVVVSIEKEFTIGYWMAVRELTRRTVGWFQGKNIALAIQRTIKGLGNIVVTHYMMCLPVPDWVWIDLHSLYTLSVKVRKETAKVPDDLDRPSKTSTSEESYIQVLLLSLTEPGGLMQREVQQVYTFLGKFGYLARLDKKPVAVQMSQCSVLIDEDIPPAFERSESSVDSTKLYINFTDLYKAISQRDNRMVSDKEGRFSAINIPKNSTDRLPSELIDYLEQRWLGTELHGMPCFTDRLDRYFSVGLETTHELQSSTAGNEASELEYLAQSSSERALSCRFNKEGVISIGSLVSFRKVDVPQNKRALGVVNKIIMPKQKNARLDFEVQVIAPVVYAVSYSSTPEAVGNDNAQKALLYGVKEGIEEKRFIIVDSFLLKEGDVVKLSMSQEEFLIILKDKKNVGLGYWQFECKRVVETATEPEKPVVQQKKGYDFI